MHLGIKSFATKGVGTKNWSDNSQWIPGFTMGSWIHDGFFDSHHIFGSSPLADLRISDLSKCFKTVRSSEREGSLILGPK